MRHGRTLALLALAAGLSWAPTAGAQEVCTGDASGAGVERLPGPPLRFGINPAGEAGAIGPPVAVTPEVRAETYAALRRLRPPGASFSLRLNRFFWSLGRKGVKRFERLARRYTHRGYRVELQLRYHPRPDQEGDIRRWVRFVRRVVRTFGPNERVVALQVTNEVNFLSFAPDASDAAYEGARDALIRGVAAAHRVTRRHHWQHLEVGFNWAYRNDPASERDFWEYLRDKGGRRLVRAVDWVGLDAYPGTFFPPVEPPGGERDGMVNAMSVLRECFMPIAGLGAEVPIRVEENGWPTLDPLRPYDRQAQALEDMVRAVHAFRGTYNVSDYRWFDLRDHATSSANLQHHYGLLTDDYERKPAFGAYRRLVRRFSR